MDEKVLKSIWEDHYKATVSYEEFKDFMNDPVVRQSVYQDHYTDKVSSEEFESFLGFGQSAQVPVQPQPEPKQEEGGFYNFLGKVPGVGKALQATVDAWERGINKGKDVDEGINAMIGGLSPEEGDAVLGILQRNKASIEKDKSITKKFTDDEEWSLGAAAGAWAEGVVESTAMMTRGLLDAFTDWKTASYITGRAAAGAALFGAKSAAATAATGPGAAVGGGIGATIGAISMAMGANSGLIEASQFYFQELQKELDTRGLSLTKANIFSIANDAEWLSKTRKDAATKGLIIDAFDTAAGVFGAKFGGSTAKLLVDQGLKARAKDFVKTGVKGAAIDAAFGAGGEYVSGQAIGQPTSAKELFLEANPIGPGIITGPLSLLKDNTSIVAAKKARTAAEKTNTPITAEIKENSEKMTGVPGLIDAYKSDDIEQAKTALADLATVHTPEEFSGMIQVMARIEGLSAEDVQAITAKFEETHAAAQKFNTPELQQDPERTSRAVKTRLDITQAETAETQLEEQKAAADPSLHPKYDEQIQAVREVKADLEETLGAIVAAPKLEVSDDIGFYRTRLDELETTKTTTKNESSAKTQELLELGAVLQDTISSAISEEYGETVVETPAVVQKVLYDGVEYEVTRVNKDGSFDLSSRDGKFVKAAEKTDAEWQGFVGEPAEATTTPPLPPVKKEKKSSAVTRLEKAAAAIKGSPIAQIESIGALLNITSIPDFVYAKIGDGDISAGKAVVQKAKDLHGEVKAFQSKLAGGKFFSDLDRQIAETRSRIETLEKQPTTRQIPAAETPSATAETRAIRQEPAIGDVTQQTSQVEPDASTTNDTVNEPVSDAVNEGVSEGVTDGVTVSPPNLPEKSLSLEEYEQFLDTGNVPDSALNTIAERLSWIIDNYMGQISDSENSVVYKLLDRVLPKLSTSLSRLTDEKLKNRILDIQYADHPSNTESTLSRIYEAETKRREVESNLAEETLPQETQKKLEDLSKEVTMKATTASDLYLINRRIWGLTHEQAIETAVIQDRLVTAMAKRAGISKTEMYKTLAFTKNPTSIPGNALSDGIAVMYALTNPNVSTPVHELVHVFERYLTDAEKQTVLAEFGGNEWTTETSEFFARGFERYLLDGVAPTPELQTTFEKFKKWLTDIYLGIRNSVIDTPISVRMENLYASFLTDKEFHNATEKPRVFSTEDKLRGKINQEELDSLRKTIELSDIPPGQTQHIDDMIQESYEKYVTENPLLEGGIYAREEKLAKDALNGLPMDAPMQLALANVINKLRQAHLRETQNLSISKQQGDKKGLIRSISDKIDAIEDQLDMFTRALYKARSVSGRALGIGSKLIDFNAFDEVNMRAKLGERLGESGKTLSEADKAFIKDLSSKINQEVQDIAALDIKDQEAGTKTKMIIAESQISQMKKSKMAKRTQSVLAAKANLDRILKGNIC